MNPLVVLGIGNILLSDDGVGVAVVERLAAEVAAVEVAAADQAGADEAGADEAAADQAAAAGLPEGTDLVDGGTGGMALLPEVSRARALVLVDAVDVGAAPGTVRVLAGDEIGDAYRIHLTAHQVGVADLLASARLTGVLPASVALVGVQPATLATGIGLSPQVAAAVPAAATAVREWCWKLDG